MARTQEETFDRLENLVRQAGGSLRRARMRLDGVMRTLAREYRVDGEASEEGWRRAN